MSEYIPTTEEMRESIYPGVRHLFDRWLAKEKGGSYRTGMKVREEQIIWLLEANIEDVYGEDIYRVADIIALIRGEQK